MSYSDVAATPSDAAVSVCNIATHAILMAPMVLAARRHQYGLAAPSVAFDRAHNVGCIVRMAAQLVEVLVGALVDAAPPRRTPFYLTLLNHTALAYGGLLGGALPIGRTGDCHERRAVAGLGDGGGI